MDVSETQWFHDQVLAMAGEKVLNGRSCNRFEPYEPITRAEFLAILHRMSGSPVVNYAMDFEDVDPSSWYGEVVRWAASLGIAEGNDGVFGPTRTITRQEAAAMLYRYSEATGSDGDGIAAFPDSGAVSAWAIEAMDWAVNNGIFGGRDDGTLDPQGNTTRAEAAAILSRLP